MVSILVEDEKVIKSGGNRGHNDFLSPETCVRRTVIHAYICAGHHTVTARDENDEIAR